MQRLVCMKMHTVLLRRQEPRAEKNRPLRPGLLLAQEHRVQLMGISAKARIARNPLISEMADRVHPLMQDANDCDAVAHQPEIDDMLFHCPPAIAHPNGRTVLRPLRGLRQIGAGGFDQIGINQRLGQPPLLHGVIENPLKIALRPWTEPEFSHAARICAA